jgi:hypothetical protein
MVTMTLDPMAYLQRLMADLAFAQQIRGDARRTILCRPDEAPGMLAAVDQLRIGDVITVKASPMPPKGTVYVIDDAALEASQAQAMQRFINTPISRWVSREH